jgi:uncharacterized membrane protein YagU involved in acid resistance
MKKMLVGAASGLIATLPMTAGLLLGHHLLPPHLRYPLPPRLIMDRTSRALSTKEGTGLLHAPTLTAHFAFGATAGGLYEMLIRGSEEEMTRPGAGAVYGAFVWSASYLGWIPAAGLLAPATRHPKERVAVMLGAHIVWGLALVQGIRWLNSWNRQVREKKAGNDN